MKWRPFIIVGSALAIGGIGIAAYFYFQRQKKLLEDYIVKPISFKFLKLTATEIIIQVTIRITNRSSIQATIQELYTDVYINDTYAGYAANTSPAVIAANGQSDISMQLSFSPKLVLNNVVDILIGSYGKNVFYKLKGYVRLKSGFIKVSVPFDYQGTASDFLSSSVPVMS